MTLIKPLLIVVTGRPASGKTTLSGTLSQEIKYPLIARDELKAGYINTFRSSPGGIAADADIAVSETFFRTIELMIAGNISIIAEAAFQHKLWFPRLAPLMDKTDIRMIICELSPQLARERYISRMDADPGRELFHRDSEEVSKESENSLIHTYKAPELSVPTLRVDTTAGYQPAIPAIIEFITKH